MKRRLLSLLLAVSLCTPNVIIPMHAAETDQTMQLQYASPTLPGDVDGNGIISEDDLTILSKHVAKITGIGSGEYLNNADVNSDGEVNAEDITALAAKFDLDNNFRIAETTVNTESAMVGSTFEWTAYALGGEGQVEYSFELRKVNDVVTYGMENDESIIASQSYSTEDKFSVTLNEAGTYAVTVYCADESGTVCSLSNILPVTVTNTGFDGISIKTDKTKYVCANDSIEWSIDTIGGNAPFTYEYTLYYNNRKVDSTLSSNPIYYLESCTEGVYQLFVECTDVDDLCHIEYSDTLTVIDETAYYPDAPFVWVEGEWVSLSDTVEEAKRNEAQSITLMWNSIPTAKEYGLELCYYAAGQWISVHEAYSIDNTTYTLPYSLLKSAVSEKLYRIGVFSKGIAEGQVRYYYFYMTPTTADKSIVVEDGQVTAWDIATVNSVSRHFDVSSELDYTVSSDVDWITCVKGADGFVATVAENSNHVNTRAGFITVDNNENTFTIQVNQGNGQGAPILLYPHLSSDAEKPTEWPVGGITLEFEEKYANYIGVRIYELSADETKTAVYENIVSSDTDFLHITEEDCDKNFTAGKKYLIELAGRYSASYAENEVEHDVEKALFYVEMLTDGHEILVEGTDYIELNEFKSARINLYSTNAWTYTVDADWVHVEDYQSVDIYKDIERIDIKLDPNYSDETRVGYVTFFCGDQSAIIKITQKSWLPRIEYPTVSTDINNPTILPSCGLVFGMFAKEATCATYSNGAWSAEERWIYTSDPVREAHTLVPDNYFENNVLYRFTLYTGEYTSTYYVKFSASKTQKYIVLDHNNEAMKSAEWKISSGMTERDIEIQTSDSWTVSSNVNWLSSSVTKGNAYDSWETLTITAQANTSGEERIGVLSFKIGSTVYATLTVTQPATDYLELFADRYLHYDDETAFKNCYGSEESLILYAWANDLWGATSNSSWIKVSNKSSASGLKSGKSITIKLEANPGNTVRTGSITVYSGNAQKTVTITQVPEIKAPTLISPALSTSYKTPSVVQYGDIELKWNAVDRAVKYRVYVSPSDTTLLLPNSSFDSYEMIIENTGENVYSIVIPKRVFSINADSEDCIYLCAIDQYGYGATSRFYLCSSSGDVARINGTTTPVWDNATDIEVSQEFVVNSTSKWTAQSKSSWITIDRTSGSSGETLTVSLAQNTGAARTGYVAITVGSTETLLTVNQCAYLPQFPSFDEAMFSDDPGEPTIISTGTSSIRIAWNYEPQAQGYQLKLGMFKSNNVETVIDRASCDNKGEYTFDNLDLTPGMRYSITLIRSSHWGATATKCYFMVTDENAFVKVNDMDSIEKELDADEDSTYVTVTSSGMWTAVVNADWLLVDNEPITQADLDKDEYTTADFATYSGVSGGKLYISAFANTGNTYRYGTVTVKSSGVEATITIAQEPYYETAEIYSPLMAARRQDSVGLPYGNVTVRWNSCVGGAGTYQLILEEREEGSAYKYYDILEVSDIVQNSYTIPVNKLKEGGYYCLTLCSDLVGTDKDDSPAQRYYFYMKYENELTVSADVEWDINNKMVKISASANGGAGGYLYSYELLCNGESLDRSDLWDWEYYTFPLSETGNYRVRVYCCDESGVSDEFYSTAYEADNSVADLVSLSQSKLLLGTAGGNASVSINSNDAWSIESYPSWVICSALEGNNGDSIEISVKTNTSTERTGTVVFVSGAARASLSVTQESAVLKPDITYPLSGSTLDIGDISVKWKQISEADSYLVSIRDITTDVLLSQHTPVVSNEYTIPAISLANGHEYRIAVGAVVGSQTWWTESTFSVSVPEISSDSLTENEIVNHDYIRITVGTSLINQNYTHHDVITTYYEKCSICGDTTAQKTDTVTVAHNFTYSGHESAHPHAKFQRCSCGAAPYIEGAFKTANGQVQGKNLCCICQGHSYDNANPKEVNGQWRVYCTKCGNYKSVNAPTVNNPVACTHPNGFNMKRTVTNAQSCTNVNEKYFHMAYNSSFTVYCCSLCGTADNSTKSTSISNQQEPHKFSTEAICASCGFVSKEGVYDCTERYVLLIQSNYFIENDGVYTGIGQPLSIKIYDCFTGITYRASEIHKLPNVTLTLKDKHGIAKIENDTFIASDNGVCEVILSYYGKQIDSEIIVVTVLSVYDEPFRLFNVFDFDNLRFDFDKFRYRINSSGAVRVEDLDNIDWREANVLLTPWAAMGNYVAKQNSDGSYTISFEVYNQSAEIFGFAVFDDTQRRVNDDVALIKSFWGTGSFIGGAWETLSKTVQLFNAKSFDEAGCETTKITLNVPEGGYIRIVDATDDLKVFSANFGQLLLGAIKFGDTTESLVTPTDVNVKALVDALGKEELVDIIYHYLVRTYGSSIDEVVSHYITKNGGKFTAESLIETELNGGLWDEIINSIPESVLKTIGGEIEDVGLAALHIAAYYTKHLVQLSYDYLGIAQLEKAFYRCFNGTNTVYVIGIITPHRYYNEISVDNVMLLNDACDIADTTLYSVMRTSQVVESQNFYYGSSDISVEGTNNSTNATDVILYSASPTYLTLGDSNIMATVPGKAKVGDTITVILANEAMTVSSFTGGIQYDNNKLSLVSIAGGEETAEAINITRTSDNAPWNAYVHSTLDEAKANGNIGFAFVNSKDDTYIAGSFATITFEVIADGTAEIIVYEDSAGNDGVITSYANEIVCQDITNQVQGDINGDGIFDYYDVSKLFAFYRGKTTLDDTVDTDINGDGIFDYYDVSKLFAIYRGKATFN